MREVCAGFMDESFTDDDFVMSYRNFSVLENSAVHLYSAHITPPEGVI